MTDLVKLDLSKNLLKSLPEKFGELVNLRQLDLLGKYALPAGRERDNLLPGNL